jgi:hypothetical protein
MIGATLVSLGGLFGTAAGAIGVFAPKSVTRGTILRIVCFAMFAVSLVLGSIGVIVAASEAQAAQDQLDRIEEYLRSLRANPAVGLALVGGTLATAGASRAAKPTIWHWFLLVAVLLFVLSIAYIANVVKPWN